jgi:hypothetical protein
MGSSCYRHPRWWSISADGYAILLPHTGCQQELLIEERRDPSFAARSEIWSLMIDGERNEKVDASMGRCNPWWAGGGF